MPGRNASGLAVDPAILSAGVIFVAENREGAGRVALLEPVASRLCSCFWSLASHRSGVILRMRIKEHDPVANSASAFVDQALSQSRPYGGSGKRAFAQGNQNQRMLIRFGYELTFNCPRPTMIVCLLDAHRERSQELHYERFPIQRTKRMIMGQEHARTLRPRLSTNPWWRRLSRWLPACSWDC